MKKKLCALLTAIVCVSALILTGCSSANGTIQVQLDPSNPTTVSIWHYYNGAQQDAFNRLVSEFNDTVGKETGIIVESFSQGNVTDLENSVLDAVNQKVGASEMPSIFAAYADTAYAADNLGLAVDLSPYLTEEELSRFIESYWEEGRFSPDSGLKIFPIAKSTEIFMLNKTDWDAFAAATGADVAALETFEGITRTAKAYYEWTDSLTAAPNDGKAFFGRDAMANLFIIGAKQLGTEIFSVQDGKPVLHFDRDVIRKIWDNYYVPFVRGYFFASGRFRSDDVKTGEIISFIGSSSGATFFPDEVILNDTESYPIEMQVFACPHFEGGEHYAVQQGAGMVVTNTNEKEIYASVQFLKWFTNDERNIQFSISSGYLPVTKQANDIEKIRTEMSDSTESVLSIITAAIQTVNDNTLYTTKAFENGTLARNILEDSMADKAVEDRAAVLASLQDGASYEDAVAAFDNEDNFNAWYEQTKAELEALMQ